MIWFLFRRVRSVLGYSRYSRACHSTHMVHLPNMYFQVFLSPFCSNCLLSLHLACSEHQNTEIGTINFRYCCRWQMIFDFVPCVPCSMDVRCLARSADVRRALLSSQYWVCSCSGKGLLAFFGPSPKAVLINPASSPHTHTHKHVRPTSQTGWKLLIYGNSFAC